MACGDDDEKANPPDPTPLAASIQLEPADALHLDALGATRQLHATVLDEEGQVLPDVRVDWSSSHPAVVSVSETGKVEALANGEAVVEARVEELSASLTVKVAQATTELRVQPGVLHLVAVGATADLEVQARDRSGHLVEAPSIHWRSIDAAIATVDEKGRVTAVAEGSTTVVAEVPGSETRAQVEVHVVPKPVRLDFAFDTEGWAAGEPVDVEVHVLDASGHTVGASGIPVRLRLGESVPGGRLQGSRLAHSIEGVALFSGLEIDKAGGAYSLIAEVEGVGTWESPLFHVRPGQPARLAFRTQPSTVRSGDLLAPAVVVEIQDRGGNRVASELSIEMRLESPAGASLQGQTLVQAEEGLAVFDSLTLDRAGGGNVLVARASGLEEARSLAFEVRAGRAAALSFLRTPATGISGLPLTPAPQVEVLDAAGNRSSEPVLVHLRLSSQPGPGELVGSRSVQAVDGVATFPGLSLQRAGAGYVLLAEAEGLAPAQSAPLAIEAGQPQRLAFVTHPAPVAAGATMGPVEVEVLDAAGNRVQTASTRVHLSIEGAGGASLLGTGSVNAVQGVAVFSGLSVQKAGSNYLLRASADGLPSVLSHPFEVSAASAAQLVFTAQPHKLSSGASFSDLRVELRDAFGNRVAEDGRAVQLELARDPSGKASLVGSSHATTSQGVARFTNVGVAVAGSGYTLRARSGGLEVESAPFDVSPGPARRLAFLSEPQELRSGIPFAISVEVLDAAGIRVVSGNTSVRLALQGGEGPLLGNKSATATAGVAHFQQLRIGATGNAYTLVASATELDDAATGTFSVRPGPAAKLAFRTLPPTPVTAGQTWAPAVVVEALDAAGNPTKEAAGSVTISIDQGPTGSKLLGVRSAQLVDGAATFSQLAIDKAGSGYVLVATSSSLEAARSEAFAVVAGEAVALAFQRQPQTTTAGQSLLPVEVVLHDAWGNLATQPAPQIRLVLEGDPNATLGGSTEQSPTDGLARFTGLRVNQAKAGYTLRAEANGLQAATSLPFTIHPAAASQLAFLNQPQNRTAGQSLLPALRVEARDPWGNAVPSATGTVVMRLGANTGNATLSGSTAAHLQEGVATFPNLVLDKAGEQYTMVAEAAGLGEATSDPFDILPANAARLAFRVQPGTGKAGQPLPAVEVEVRDAFDNPLPQATATVSLRLGSGRNDLLHGDRVAAVSDGVARFDALRIDQAGEGYTLVASATGLAATESLAFRVEAGDAGQIRFLDQPPRSVAGATWTPLRLELLDPFGNRAVHFDEEVSLALEGGPAGALLEGATPQKPNAGIVTFSGLSVKTAGKNYVLAAHAPKLPTAHSQPFDIDPGEPDALAFVPDPKGTIAGETLDPFTVEIRDPYGNLVPAADLWVSLSLGSQPAGATLVGSASRLSQGGVATFDELILPKAGGYTLIASIPSGIQKESAPFAVSTGEAVKLAFLTQPSDGVSMSPIAPTVSVAFLDASDNLVESGESITLRPGPGSPAGANLIGHTATAVAGIAEFPALAVDIAGTYTLVAEAASLESDPSASFQIRHGAAK